MECAPPAQVGKADAAGSDDSPAALDPGDTWTYACSKKTTANADCTPSAVPNTGTVSGAAGGQAVSDRSRIQTSLGCPPQPKPPQPQPPNPGPQPTPTPPSPIVPPGPAPPDADAAGRAGVLVRRARQSCIRSPVPRVQIHGTRIARVQVYVDGQLQRTLTVDSLQSRSTPRVTLRRGSYGVKVRVTFQRGTASPPVTLSTSIRICARERAAPVFTG